HHHRRAEDPGDGARLRGPVGLAGPGPRPPVRRHAGEPAGESPQRVVPVARRTRQRGRGRQLQPAPGAAAEDEGAAQERELTTAIPASRATRPWPGPAPRSAPRPPPARFLLRLRPPSPPASPGPLLTGAVPRGPARPQVKDHSPG